MPKKLRKLVITRVDLVPAGANPDAHIVLFKSAEFDRMRKEEHGNELEPLPLTTEQILQRQALWAQWHPLWDAFTSSVWEIMGCCEDMAHHAPVLMESIDQFASRAKEILAGLNLMEKATPLFALFDEVAKAGRVMSARRMQRLKEAMTTLQTLLDEAMVRNTKHTQAVKGAPMSTLEDVIKRAETAEARAETAEARVHALETELRMFKMTPEEQEAAYMNGLPEPVRKRLEATEARAKAAEEAARVEKNAREQQQYIAKTAAYRHLGITPDHWNVLKAIDALPEQEQQELLRILASANEVIKHSDLLVAIGKDGGGESGTSAYTRLETIAKEYVQSGEATTVAVGMDLAIRRHPALYNEYQSERKG